MSLWFGRTSAYQRRTARPVTLLVTVLAAVTVITWSMVLLNTSDAPNGSVCPAPAQPGAARITPIEKTTLEQTAPVAPSTVRIRVLNGGGQRGQANLVATQLGELGFTEAAEPTNDPLYPDSNLTCRGNIRFGASGAAAARTVSLAVPCVPLVRDSRTDDSVDVAVGNTFGEVNPGKPARDALDQLSGPSGSADDDSQPTPAVDQELLTKATDVPC